MSEKNGILKTVRIAWILILIAGLLVTFGISYQDLNGRIKTVKNTAIQANDRSQNNRDIIISMQSDLKYIVKAVDELRDKR